MTPLVFLAALASATSSAANALPLRAATYNVAALSARDSDARFEDIAATLKSSGFPAIVALQEIADDDGLNDSGNTRAQASLGKLSQAVANAGGPPYKALYFDPDNNSDGGPPGANIRCVVLTDAKARATATPLFVNDSAFSATRKPLHVRLHLEDGALDVVVVHLSASPTAKRKRALQAQQLAAWVHQQAHAESDVIVMGDFNAVDDEQVWATFKNAGLHDTAAPGQPTHESGNAFDRILISDGLQAIHAARAMPRTAGSDHALVWVPLHRRADPQGAGCSYTPRPLRSPGWPLFVMAWARLYWRATNPKRSRRVK